MEENSLQLCDFLIRHKPKISSVKLLGLIYLIDKISFIKTGTPVTSDSYSHSENGPVPVNLFMRIACGGRLAQRNFPQFPSLDYPDLSEFIIGTSFKTQTHFQSYSDEDFISHMKSLPEWKPEKIGMILHPDEILMAEGLTEQEIAHYKNMAF